MIICIKLRVWLLSKPKIAKVFTFKIFNLLKLGTAISNKSVILFGCYLLLNILYITVKYNLVNNGTLNL